MCGDYNILMDSERNMYFSLFCLIKIDWVFCLFNMVVTEFVYWMNVFVWYYFWLFLRERT